MDPLFRDLIPFLYLICAILYSIHFFGEGEQSGKIASLVTSTVVVIHMLVIVEATYSLGFIPFTDIFGAVSIFAWFAATAYLLLESAIEDRVFGQPVLSIIFIFLMLGSTITRTHASRELVFSPVFEIHVASSLFSYVVFLFSSISAILYILLYNEIANKRFGFFFNKIPSLDLMEKVIFYGNLVGVVLLTVGIISGIKWSFDIWNRFILDPKFLNVIISWLIYTVLLASQRMGVIYGKRSAWLTIVAFVIVIINFFTTGLLFPSVHAF